MRESGGAEHTSLLSLAVQVTHINSDVENIILCPADARLRGRHPSVPGTEVGGSTYDRIRVLFAVLLGDTGVDWWWASLGF